MPPKVDSKTSESDKEIQDTKLSILIAKREAIFGIMQNVFDLSREPDVHTNVEKREHFLDESSQIDSLRLKYESIVDDYNTRLLNLNSDAKPDYKSLYAFETLYNRVKRTHTKCSTLNTTPEIHNATSALLKAKPKLAPISILEFDGDIKSFQMFYTTFKSVVDNNPSLTDAEKLFYLLPKLTGKAKSAIAGISPCAENYQLILQTLVNRFDDKRMLTSAYLHELFRYKGFQTPSATNFEDFIDRFAGAVSALKNLKLENLADLIILHIATQRVDTESVRAFEIKCGKNIPTFDDFVEFITTRAKVFERTNTNVTNPSNTRHNKNIKHLNNGTSGNAPKYQAYISTVDKPTSKCLCRNITHAHLYKCVDFNKLLTPQVSPYFKCVKEKNACVNCLSIKHKVGQCEVSPHCSCGQKHNKRLHFDQREEHSRAPQLNTVMPPPNAPTVTASSPVADDRADVALCATRVSPSTSATQVYNSNLMNRVEDKRTTVLLATAQVAVYDCNGERQVIRIPLADASYGVPDKIDALIGASLFPHLLLPDDVHTSRRDPSVPVALRTVLGLVFMGNAPTIPTINTHTALTCCFVQEPPAIDSLVKRFWELEELPSASIQNPDDNECEDFYTSTTVRDPDTGRYVVGLPFKEDLYSLGNSLDIAKKRFICLERKLEASNKLRSAYDDVIKGYLAKDYISPAPSYDSKDPVPIYVMPHTGILREDKLSTRLRLVVDASCRSSSGKALNHLLHSGQNLQGDLFKIILNFRLHAVAMTADCREQFLQIVMREADRRYQCFLYRFNPQDPLVLYQFNRVCFGLTSSPFHALRTVRQLVNDDGAKYPRANSIVLPALYMDDVAFSLPSELEAVTVSLQMIDLFKGAQWELVKWNSNSREVLDNLPASHKLPTEVEFDKTMHHKILGLHWSTGNDAFYFKISMPDDVTCTKRSILSTVARLWDIMGFVAPTVVYAKILIKMLWQLNLDWDTVAPPHIIKMWRQFCDELPALNKLHIPRHVGVTTDCEVTLLGLSDASLAAYGAVVYLHVSSPTGNTVRLACAKSKVSPTKPHSIARLELLGGVLLSKLLRTVHDTYSERIPIKATYAFLDSKVALYWIKSSPHRWQTFVANRVVQITENISPDNFYHCPGTENSADILSRGVTPEKLLSHPLWLHGPPWASMHPSQWPLKTLEGESIEDVPEKKVLIHTVCKPILPNDLHELALRFSSWSKLLRIIVYICRFAKLLPRRGTSAVTADDLNFAENRMLRALQNQHFAEEYSLIKNNKTCSPAFNRLRPFIDDGLIRVGGRLANSGLSFEKIHPVILPRNGHVVNIIIDYYHIKHLHAGPELLMALLRQRYWILSARRIVRQRVHMCNTCFRFKPRPTIPLMADLPDIRTRPALKAFSFTGCDYAGPIPYVPVRRRGVHSEKAYIVLFTCLTTRSTHIEVATSLSTPSFLAGFKRFLSRRGPVQVLHSDNAKNFQGAASYLRDLYKFLREEYYPKLEQECAENRITWKFICPNSPHFGGSWESMIKVTKTILFKVIGQQLLSYEELCTVLIQVECLLNSRPLTILSSDPAEPSALTPSHFLHTAPLFSLPAPDVNPDKINLVDRYSLIDKMVQSFWNRWRMEYLHGLQVRLKWNTPSVPITPGTVVVVINDNVPPLAWPLAVVEKVHPSKDGVIRVATVKISGRTYVRPVVRLCPLPTQ
ncbi:uncharacterized protein LOC120628775 [Pararge aegeria]|uniref:uncharacterized protein LOC120628775 n=1 Tax=Pararge aegeria TaxID=116150 RepID=UPI0019D14307|nr:uncharacterized protein LOC120628775 [Pararge aegeria]